MKKKIIIFSLFLNIGLLLKAQEQEIKSSTILPVAGDISFGIDALPYLNYLGNIFNNTVGNTLTLGNNNIYVRYFLSDDIAVRAIININSVKQIDLQYVQDDAAVYIDPLSQDKVEDKRTTFLRSYGLNLGVMKTRGYERLRGFYGAQLGYLYNRNLIEYQYGNQMTLANPNPSTWLFGRAVERPLQFDDGIVQTIGAGVFLGVEYYFLPKVCIGGEASLSLNYSFESQSNSKVETMQNGQRYEINRPISPGNRLIRLSTFRPATYAGLYVMFNF